MALSGCLSMVDNIDLFSGAILISIFCAVGVAEGGGGFDVSRVNIKIFFFYIYLIFEAFSSIGKGGSFFFLFKIQHGVCYTFYRLCIVKNRRKTLIRLCG